MSLRALAGVGDQAQQLLETGAAVLRQLAPEQVQGLDAVSAFMNRIEPVVAVVLLNGVLAGVTMTAEHLNRQFIGFEAEFRRPGFDNGGQQVQQFMGVLADVFCFPGLGVVEQP